MTINTVIDYEQRAQIFSYLDTKEVVKATEVCKQWQREIPLIPEYKKHLANRYFHQMNENRKGMIEGIKGIEMIKSIQAGNLPENITVSDDHPLLILYDTYQEQYINILTEGLSTESLEKAIKVKQEPRKLEFSADNRQKFDTLRSDYQKATETQHFDS